jgi:integrase
LGKTLPNSFPALPNFPTTGHPTRPDVANGTPMAGFALATDPTGTTMRTSASTAARFKKRICEAAATDRLARGFELADCCAREHLTLGEVNALIEAAKANRWGHRDATMILLAFRHGLRVAELCDLRWDQVEFNAAVLHVRRVKNGTPSTHPLLGDELRALRRLKRESTPSPYVFVSERGSPFTTAGFARMVERAAASAGLELKAHPHMLRHACGYALANRGHDTRAIQGWLGHRSITSTAVYTALAPNRFKDFWRDGVR